MGGQQHLRAPRVFSFLLLLGRENWDGQIIQRFSPLHASRLIHSLYTPTYSPLVMKPVAILVAAAALAGCGVEAFQPRAPAPMRMSAAAAPKAAPAGADKKSEEPLLLRAAKGEVRAWGIDGWLVGWTDMGRRVRV